MVDANNQQGEAGDVNRLRPAPWLDGFQPYRTAPAGAPCDLRLDGNEGIEPPMELIDALRDAGPDVMRRYPDQRAVARMLAERIDVEPERVLVTAGADAALDRICRAFLAPGREIVLTAPTFEMLPRYAALSGATVREVAWFEEPFPVERIEAAMTPDTHVVAIVTPNNPTGEVAPTAALTRLAAARPDVLFIVDLAYVEFADDDPTPALLPFANVVMTRTLSKAWGLAGLRVGYAIGAPEVIAWLRAAGGPYDVSRPSLAMAAARLGAHDPAIEDYRARVRRERGELRALARDLGAAAGESQGNFALLDVPDALWLRDALAGLGIAVRAFPGRPRMERRVRITCPGNDAEFDRLRHGLCAALAPDAVLFDLDGVLADVSRSFREAIIATGATYGVEITHAQIAAIKREGDANNDWIVTRRLLARAGVDRPQEEVTARFERIYQGDGDTAGLHETETLVVDRAVLEQMAAQVPLAIVTGRPRRDALRFLEQKEIADLFATVVCMEDAPVKPDPAPVRLALERLELDRAATIRAWMIGDTPDDVRAARTAGVVPIGIVAPGERDVASTTDSLIASGAARVVDSVNDLADLLARSTTRTAPTPSTDTKP